MRHLNILVTLILIFTCSSMYGQYEVQEVDSAYMAQIESLIIQAEAQKAIGTYNDQLIKDEMKFEYSNLIPLARGFVSIYTRHDFITNHPAVFEHKDFDVQDYAVASSPLVAAWIMKIAGVKSRSTTRRMLTSNAFALAIAAGLTQGTKHIVKEHRPDLSDNHSFPSGHTALAYVGATVLSREYGHISPWITVGGYGAATATSILRIHHNAHWLNDVYMGAGIGVVSTNVGYWLADQIYGAEGINRPEMTLRDLQRVLKMADRPSSFALVASTDFGRNSIMADNLVFSDAASALGKDDYHVHLSSFSVAGIEASWYLTPYFAIEGIAQSSVAQAKVYSLTNNVFTGNTLRMYRGSLALKGSFLIPGTPSRFGARLLTGIRSIRGEDFYLTDRESYNPVPDYCISLPTNTKFELGCGVTFDMLATKSHVIGINIDYCHAFSHIIPNRFLLGTSWKVLF